MKRKLTLTFDPRHVTQAIEKSRLMGLDKLTITGEFHCTIESLRRFVDVRLLDARGVSENQRQMTWTYEDTLDPPLEEGEYVMVPFGYSDKLHLAKVEGCSDEPTYDGLAPIKLVEGRVGLVDA